MRAKSKERKLGRALKPTQFAPGFATEHSGFFLHAPGIWPYIKMTPGTVYRLHTFFIRILHCCLSVISHLLSSFCNHEKVNSTWITSLFRRLLAETRHYDQQTSAKKTYSSMINISAFIYQMVHVSTTFKALNKCLWSSKTENKL